MYDNNYINFYNNLVYLTRNKNIYKDFIKQDSFSDRLIIFLFHFAFFLNVFKSDSLKKDLQNVFDYVFKNLEISIREIGYGDATINKKMKNYINIFYLILSKIELWDSINLTKKKDIFSKFIDLNSDSAYIIEYFDNYRNFLTKSTFNSLIKSVNKLKF